MLATVFWVAGSFADRTQADRPQRRIHRRLTEWEWNTMARKAKVWGPIGARGMGGRTAPTPPPAEKAAITAACERFIAERLIPRYLPEIRPQTTFNYPIYIYGKWQGGRYRMMTRYKCAGPNRTADEFDAPFARLDYVHQDCFDLYWHRHIGTWHAVGHTLSLNDALTQIADSGIFMPC